MCNYIKFYMVDMKSPIADIAEYLDGVMQTLVDDRLITIISMSEVETAPSVVEEVVANQFVYEVKLHSSPASIFYVHFSFETFSASNRLAIELSSESYRLEITADSSTLEKMKISLSKKLRGDWENCTWLHDRESQMYASDLYPYIHETESLVRQFINEVMINLRGINWWQIVPKTIANKLGKTPRAGDITTTTKQQEYKSVAPSFRHIDEKLMLLDIGDLKKIMELKQRKLTNINSRKVNDIINGHENPTEDSYGTLIGELRSASEIEIDIWGQYFSPYLPPDFPRNFSKFDSNRNHVAHNKLLDFQAYSSIKESTTIIHDAVSQAFERFHAQNLSEEEIAAQRQIRELQEQQEADLRNSAIESDTDLTLHSETSVCRMFQEKCMDFYGEIEGDFGLRMDLDISEFISPEYMDEENELFTITHKVKDDQIKFFCMFDICEGWGSTSSMEITLKHNDIAEKRRVTFTNGNYEYNGDQGYYMPTEDEEFDDTAFNNAVQDFIEYLDENFEDLMEVANAQSHVSIKDGGEASTTEDVACCECGEFSICVDESIAPFGQCLKCGAENEITRCERCESYMEGSTTEDGAPLC